MPEFNRTFALDANAIARLYHPRLAIFGTLGLALFWLIVSHSIVAYLSTTAPKTALLLHRNEPTSLITLAENEINLSVSDKADSVGSSRMTPKRLKLLRDQVETALVADPLSSRAYRLLGHIAESQGAVRNAEAFMRTATRHSLHEGYAVSWMMLKSFERKDYSAAAYYADALLRSRGPYGKNATSILARMAEEKSAVQEVKKLLVTNPRWRAGFFDGLGAYIANARTPLDLFLSLQDTQAPATMEEINAYQSFLFRHKLYELAYFARLHFLPPEKLEAAGFLFNGDFETRPSGSPFDWLAPAGENVIVDFGLRPGSSVDHALALEFGPGRVYFPGVSQSIMLPPGAYVFSGSLNGEVTGRRGVRWSVSCMGGASLGQSEMIVGSFPQWRVFQFSFIVPETACPAQLLQLKLAARSPSEELVSGAIWFDAFSISRDKENASK